MTSTHLPLSVQEAQSENQFDQVIASLSQLCRPLNSKPKKFIEKQRMRQEDTNLGTFVD